MTKPSRLKDNSWIRKVNEEEEAVDDDPNFGKSILHRYKTNESPAGDDFNKSGATSQSTSAQSYSKRYVGSQDELKSSTTTTTITKDGKTTETTITTSQNVSSPVSKTSSKTETFTERVKSSSKGPQYSSYSPTKTTKVTETTAMSNKDAEDKLYDTLLPSTIKDFSPSDSKTGFSKTETVVVKSGGTNSEDKLYDDYTNGKKSISSSETVTVRSSSNGVDDPYDSLVYKDPTFNLSNSVSRSSVTKREVVTVESSSRNYSSYTDDIPSTRSTSYTISTTPSTDRTYSYRTESSPSVYTSSSYKSSRSDEILSDPIYSKSSIKSVYAAPERPVLEKDLCTTCRKPFTGDAKIVLEDMKINCHASCFKCNVCNNTLGHLKAGDSMWIYKRMVHCENCFETTRDKWRR